MTRARGAGAAHTAAEATPSHATVSVRNKASFGRLVERHGRELQRHCYRITGSLEDSEDAVQETFLRAWRSRRGFEARGSARAWLYRIATNASLDVIAANRRRETTAEPGSRNSGPGEPSSQQADPDALIEGVAPREDEPDARLVSRETIEIMALLAVQQLPPRQRAALILRDMLGRSAKETASMLNTGLPAVTSALQRARANMREALGGERSGWAPAAAPSEDERVVLEWVIHTIERGDAPEPVARLARELQRER